MPGGKFDRMSAGSDVAQIQPAGDGSHGIFIVRHLPPYGYRVYRQVETNPPESTVRVSSDGTTLENANLLVTIDAATGCITNLLDKRTQRQIVRNGGSANRLEIHWERLDGMSAWNIGPIDHVEVVNSTGTIKVAETGPARVAVEVTRKWRENTIIQRVALTAGGDMVDCSLNVDWKETGDQNRLSPDLRLAFDLDLKDPVVNYDIPFGNVARPADGREYPMVKWVDLSATDYGFSLINDCKHGLSVKDGVLRWTIIRTPCNPDSHSDCYPQVINYALYPHTGDWRAARVDARGIAFLHPVLTAVAAGGGNADLPAECSFIRSGSPNVLITCVKRAEDDDDLVVRCYESQGRKGSANLSTYWTVRKARTANFVEDVQPGSADVVAQGGKTVSADMRGYEIRTMKLALRPLPGVTLSGTRGGGPPRSY